MDNNKIVLTTSIHLAIHFSTVALASSTSPSSKGETRISIKTCKFLASEACTCGHIGEDVPNINWTLPLIPDSSADAIQA